MSSSLKAPEKTCQGCEAIIPAQASGPGRPRKFCSRRCRRDHYHRAEQAQIERERAEEAERRTQEYETRIYGKRAADQMARDRARNREGRTNGST
jgi:hypothetical protein